MDKRQQIFFQKTSPNVYESRRQLFVEAPPADDSRSVFDSLLLVDVPAPALSEIVSCSKLGAHLTLSDSGTFVTDEIVGVLWAHLTKFRACIFHYFVCLQAYINNKHTVKCTIIIWQCLLTPDTSSIKNQRTNVDELQNLLLQQLQKSSGRVMQKFQSKTLFQLPKAFSYNYNGTVKQIINIGSLLHKNFLKFSEY